MGKIARLNGTYGETPKNYPVKEVDTVIRIKKADGAEWFASTQTWTGLDRYGNEMNKSFVYPEVYDKPNFSYQPIKSKSKSNNTIDNDPNNPFPKFERMATSVVYTKEHTLPFTLENLEQLWNSYGRRVDLGYPLVLRMRAQEIVQIEGLKDMKTLKNHLTSYGNGLLLRGSAWIEV